jgi:hypothetical protein
MQIHILARSSNACLLTVLVVRVLPHICLLVLLLLRRSMRMMRGR